jgi:2-(1,2-epoxy-1,2-dihydrophenyl)acetyl-CoA isomerase
MAFETLRYELADGIATLTLCRPAARNALDMTMRAELAQLLATLHDDTSARALILTGAGECFCAGGDLRAMREAHRPPHASRARVKAVHRWLRDLVNLEIPVIAAVDGAAYGAGFSLALAADFVLATPRARFCAVFGRIGLVPDLGMFHLLPRIVGLARAKELIYSARVLPASEAHALGIVYALHEPQALLPAARALAARFTHASREALGLSKNILNQSHHLDQHALEDLECHAQALCMDTDYYREAVRRTLGKEGVAFDWERLGRKDD